MLFLVFGQGTCLDTCAFAVEPTLKQYFYSALTRMEASAPKGGITCNAHVHRAKRDMPSSQSTYMT